ncbi:hypothetical protein FNH05_23310 [Amycolatopsis rhizosphaerae]|uniref:Uncharacterized protein n=1 Tax=Amycolatopsis rhizosphaerae TaxID=2053003 RepID=A0A558BWI4_9PSEU|nr:hypothetical protein [Amycolatopsis rhizosphaerae]TVT40862.1 hypothetical protein FNH05_23310 [Amycolatopsis rhizosphaerae]
MSLRAAEFSILEPTKNFNYGSQDLFSARDNQIRDLLLKVKDGTMFEQAKQFLPRDGDRVLSAFAKRAASMAVRHQDARELRAGILAAAIDQEVSSDFREGLPALALLYRAAEMIGRNPDLEFSAINDLSGGRARSLVDFLRRPPEDKSIEAMGFEEGDDKQGFRFLSNWW